MLKGGNFQRMNAYTMAAKFSDPSAQYLNFDIPVAFQSTTLVAAFAHRDHLLILRLTGRYSLAAK